MLVVLLKKTDYNTKVADIDGKIAKNEDLLTEIGKGLLPYMSGNILFDGGDGSQVYLVFEPVHKYVKIIANTK